MKTNFILLTSLIALIALGGHTAFAGSKTDIRPTGTLDVSRKLVRTGVKPMINWDIQYPVTIDELISINAMNTVVPQQDVLVEVRVVGTSYQPYGEDATVDCRIKIGNKGNNGHGNNVDGVDVSNPGQGGGGPNGIDDPSGEFDDEMKLVFSGRTKDLTPSEPVFSQVVKAGTPIDISGKGHLYSSYWTPTRETGIYSYNVMALTDGDDVPYYSPAFQQGDIESHVSSYVTDGKIVLNPRDVIHLVELGQNDPASGGFDMQDLVVVISFKDVPR